MINSTGNRKISLFGFSLFLVLFYEIGMSIVAFTGVTFEKIVLTSLLWIVVLISIYLLIKDWSKVKHQFPVFAIVLYGLLLAVNTSAIFRSLIYSDISLTTSFGNIYNSLGLLVPFSISFGLRSHNIFKILKLLFFGLLFSFVLLISLVFLDAHCWQQRIQEAMIIALLPAAFVFPLIRYQGRRLAWLHLSVLVLFCMSYISGDRTMSLRVILVVVSTIYIYIYSKGLLKWVRRSMFLFSLVPFYLFFWSLSSGQSIFSLGTTRTSPNDLLHDTRTFLYVEVLDDLVQTHSIWTGKGADGTYFSQFFHTTKGDTDTRNHVEVGVLSILLKTGVMGLTLNMGILLYASYLAISKSKNIFSFGLGVILLLYFDLLFIKYPIAYTLDNFLLWFFIGLSFSKNLRLMTNAEFLLSIKSTRHLDSEITFD